MTMPDTTLSTLAQIQTKVRRITRSPSVSQLTDAQLDDYINTFVLYDFPEHLRLWNYRQNFTFWCRAYTGEYFNNEINPTDPFYNFKNKYISLHPPVYIAGYNSFYSQSEEQFYGMYPKVSSIYKIAQGDGVTVFFTGTIPNVPILQYSVTISSVDVNNNSLTLADTPNYDALGNMLTTGGLYLPNDPILQGTIDYVTGAYQFAFPFPPQSGVAVNSQTLPYVPAMPQALLYYDGVITLRPVPDQPYEIKLEAYVRPTELLAGIQSPDLAQFWQYIAYGAAKKIFEDRMDLESVQQIMPEFKMQEKLVLRQTIVQHANERTSTIYTEQTGINGGGFGQGWGNGQF